MFRKLDLFPSSGEGVGDTYHWIQWLELALPNGPKTLDVCHPLT
jgi:hypothetical protein